MAEGDKLDIIPPVGKAATKSFDKCPNCGSEHQMGAGVLEELMAQGKAKEGTRAYVFQHSSLIMDPRCVNITAPLLTTFYDICSDCGTVYCVHAKVEVIMPSAQKN